MTWREDAACPMLKSRSERLSSQGTAEGVSSLKPSLNSMRCYLKMCSR